MLCIFTLAESFIVSFICGFYQPSDVLSAALVTAAATVALTLYAMKTKTDFSTYWHALNGITTYYIGIAWGVFLMVLFLTFANFTIIRNPFVNNLIAVVFGVIYMAYLIIDTQLIMGNRKRQITLDNYVLGAVFIYIDIVGLFLQILRILGSRRN